jgi:hypothetical protein
MWDYGRHVLIQEVISQKQLKILNLCFRPCNLWEQEALLSWSVREPLKISNIFTVWSPVTYYRLHIILTFTFIVTCFDGFLT